MKEFILETRKCECCGGDDLELVYSDKTSVNTHKETYLIESFVVICKSCGFCFNSPCPKNEDLVDFYADYLSTYDNMPLFYSIETRLETLKKYAGGNFVEVGGNQSSEFYDDLKKYFTSIKNVEPNRDCSSDFQTINQLPKNSVDVLAHYDVLEHIPDVKKFLSSCNSALKNNGIMVMEVPDIKLYPKNLMLLSASEHFNHFSVNTLENIAGQCDFKLVEVSHAASRPFSFLAIFKKGRSYKNNSEYLDNLACLRGGIKQIDRFKNQIKDLRNRITNDKKITLWCVTDFLYRLIDGFELPENTIVVDSDIRKKGHLKYRGMPVFLPTDCLEHIKNSELLVILSPRNKSSILKWIKDAIGRDFLDNNLEVIGTGAYGEPLQV